MHMHKTVWTNEHLALDAYCSLKILTRLVQAILCYTYTAIPFCTMTLTVDETSKKYLTICNLYAYLLSIYKIRTKDRAHALRCRVRCVIMCK